MNHPNRALTVARVFLVAGLALHCGATLAAQVEGGEATAGAARALLQDARYADALLAYERLMTKEGRSYDNLMGAAESLYHLHEDNRSLTLLSEARRLAPTRPEPTLFEAHITWRMGAARRAQEQPFAAAATEDAAILYGDAARLSADPYDAWFWSAECYLELKAWEKARERAELALAKRPDEPAALRLMMRALAGGKHWDQTLVLADRVLAGEPKDLDALLRRLEALARLNRSAEATELLVRISSPELYRGEYAPFATLIDVWRDAGHAGQLLQALDAAAAANPDDPNPLYSLGWVHAQAGRREAAVDAYRRCLALVPESAATASRLGEALLDAGDLAGARAVARDAWVRAPGDEDVLNLLLRLVGAYVEARDFRSALAVHELVIHEVTEDSDLLRNHAVLLRDVGEREQAVETLEALCIASTVDNARLAGYYNDLGLFLKGLGRIAEAETRFKEAVAMWTLESNARENLALIHYRRGEDREAARLFREVVDIAAKSDPDGEKPWRAQYYLRRLRGREGVSAAIKGAGE